MIDRRTRYQHIRLASGRCSQCGKPSDRVGRCCSFCNDRRNGRQRQRYRPSMQAAEWTMALLARNAAMSVRVL